MIPNLQPDPPSGPTDNGTGTGTSIEPAAPPLDHPGRGGSAAPAGGGAGATSRGHLENFSQRGPATPFAHGEKEVAAVSGIPQKNLQRIRQKKLRAGEHWQVREDLRVAYSRAGVVELLELASDTKAENGKIAGVALEVLLQQTRIPDEPAILTGRLCRLFPNPYLIEVDLGDRRVMVRVKETKNFRRGMQVPIRPKTPTGFELARRLPRFPGRW